MADATNEVYPADELTLADGLQPQVGGLFEDLLSEYLPPVEPFAVPLRRGHVLLFRACQNDRECEDLKSEAQRQAMLIAKGIAPLDVRKHASKNGARNAQAYVCFASMDGWYKDSDTVSEPGTIKYLGDKQPAWTYPEWLRLAKECPTLFDGILGAFDMGQVRGRAKADSDVIESEKKS